MAHNITSLLEKIKRGDLSGEITKVQVLGLPGLTWFSRSEFKKAERELKKALAQVEKRDGQDHPVTALISYFLGDAYMRHGRPASAETHLLRAMEIWAHTEPDNYRAVVHMLLDLGQAYGESGQMSASESLGRAIVDSVKKNMGEGDSLIVSALSDLAVVFQMQGKPSETQDLLHEALRQSEQNAETLSRFVPRVLMNLAGIRAARREFSQAELYLDRALEIAEATEDRDGGQVLEILCNKAKVYAALGKEEELEAATTEAQVAYEDIWESDPHLAIPCMFDLVRLHEGLEKNDTAERVHSRLAEDMAAVIESGNKEKIKIISDIWFRDIGLKGPTRIIREGLSNETAHLFDHSQEFREHIASVGSNRKDARGNRDQGKTRRRT